MVARRAAFFFLLAILVASLPVTAQSPLTIRHEGSLGGDWINLSQGDTSFEAVNVSQEEIGGQTGQDLKAQIFINYLQSGGVRVGAGSGTFSDFLGEYVAERENDAYLDWYRSTFRSREDYIRERYGDRLPEGIATRQVGPHQALVYSTREEKDGALEGKYAYFIELSPSDRRGAVVTGGIKWIPEKRSYSFDSYESSMEGVIGSLRFSLRGATQGGAAIPVSGKLELIQEIHPPARPILGVLNPVGNELSNFMKKGSAIQKLVFTVQGVEPAAQNVVVVSFEIDPPAKITGPARRNVLQEGRAETTVAFVPSDTVGQGGVIFARVRFPASVSRLDGGEYEASSEMKSLTIRIRPICDESNSVYFKDHLVSDVAYDDQGLQSEFGAAIEAYGADNLSASSYSTAGLLWFLGNHGGEALGVTWPYYSGKEVELANHVLSAGASKPLKPGELFGKALELSGGDVTKALLSCHNVIRSAARGAEDFSAQLTADERRILNSDPRQLPPAEKEIYNKLQPVSGLFANSQIFKNLVPMRPGGDNPGAWYHMLATTLVSMNSQGASAFNAPQPGAELADPFDLMVWLEEYAVSRDIYSDPNEYCVDHMGLRLGDFLSEKVSGLMRIKVWNQFNAFTKQRRENPSAVPVAIAVRSPVSTTITDTGSGLVLNFDQKSGQITGELPATIHFTPESDGTWAFTALLMPARYALGFEAAGGGTMSVHTLDFGSGQTASYEAVPLSSGASFLLSFTQGVESKPLYASDGSTVAPKPGTYTDDRAKSVREAANAAAAATRTVATADSPKGSRGVSTAGGGTSGGGGFDPLSLAIGIFGGLGCIVIAFAGIAIIVFFVVRSRRNRGHT